MQCIKCGFDNPNDAKFCNKCSNIFSNVTNNTSEQNLHQENNLNENQKQKNLKIIISVITGVLIISGLSYTGYYYKDKIFKSKTQKEVVKDKATSDAGNTSIVKIDYFLFKGEAPKRLLDDKKLNKLSNDITLSLNFIESQVFVDRDNHNSNYDLCIIEKAPDNYFEFGRCREAQAKNNPQSQSENWQNICFDRIFELSEKNEIVVCAEGPEGKELYQKSMKINNILKVDASPAIFVNGHLTNNWENFTAQLCAVRTTLGVCTDVVLSDSIFSNAHNYLNQQTKALPNITPQELRVYCDTLSNDLAGYCYIQLAKMTKDSSVCSLNQYAYRDCLSILEKSNLPPTDQRYTSDCQKLTDFTQRNSCLTDVAKKHKDASICSTIEGSLYGDVGRDYCITQVAWEKKDYSLCQEAGTERDTCLSGAAMVTWDATYCDQIGDTFIKDECYLAFAINNQGGDNCHKISKTNTRDSCYYSAGVNELKLGYCREISLSSYTRINCFGDIAANKLNPDICLELGSPPNETDLADCYREYVKERPDPAVCDRIENQYLRGNCVQYLD